MSEPNGTAKDLARGTQQDPGYFVASLSLISCMDFYVTIFTMSLEVRLGHWQPKIWVLDQSPICFCILSIISSLWHDAASKRQVQAWQERLSGQHTSVQLVELFTLFGTLTIHCNQYHMTNTDWWLMWTDSFPFTKINIQLMMRVQQLIEIYKFQPLTSLI